MSETVHIVIQSGAFTDISAVFPGALGVKHVVQDISGADVEFIERLTANIPGPDDFNTGIRIEPKGAIFIRHNAGEIVYARPVSTKAEDPVTLVISEDV